MRLSPKNPWRHSQQKRDAAVERCLEVPARGVENGVEWRGINRGESWICRTDPEYRTGRPMAVA